MILMLGSSITEAIKLDLDDTGALNALQSAFYAEIRSNQDSAGS